MPGTENNDPQQKPVGSIQTETLRRHCPKAVVSSRMKGKICMITGCSSGIGLFTARELACLGATVVLVCRDKQRGEAAASQVIERSGNTDVELMLADLSSQKAIRTLAAGFESRHDRLHVLINNAATVPAKRNVTVDGLETQFAVNHLAYFMLAYLLLSVLKASAPSRIINVAAGLLHRRARLDFDDLQSEKGYRPFRTYGRTKLANVLFTYELARKLRGTGVTANCLTPGVNSTGITREFSRLIRLGSRLFAGNPEKGAGTVVYLASSPDVEGVSGKYFAKKRPVRSSDLSYDEAIARKLWKKSGEMTGIHWS